MFASNLQPLISNQKKPLASLSLDLDNQWSYMKTHGDPGWEKFPSYLEKFIPRVLDLLDQLNLKITFFVVGQDAALEKNKDVLRLISEKGHEVGNHSFNHEPWMNRYSISEIKKEILSAEEHIWRITGQKPMGFRGPGFFFSSEALKILAENGYLYDASTLPTYIGPIARMYYFAKSNLNEEEKKKRNGLFGTIKDGLRSVKPYYWKLNSNSTLLEIPVTTVPIIKTPFHLSYLLSLSRISEALMFSYLRMGISLCRMTGTEPSFLLHPLDLIDREQVPELAFFPGMEMHSHKKVKLFKKVLKEFAKHFDIVTMTIHAKSLLVRSDLKMVSPDERDKRMRSFKEKISS